MTAIELLARRLYAASIGVCDAEMRSLYPDGLPKTTADRWRRVAICAADLGCPLPRVSHPAIKEPEVIKAEMVKIWCDQEQRLVLVDEARTCQRKFCSVRGGQ